MSSNRARITLAPLRSTVHGLQGLGGAHPVPTQWSPLADLLRGDGTGGVLVQHAHTRMFALWTGTGSVETLPQDKVVAALTAYRVWHPAQEGAGWCARRLVPGGHTEVYTNPRYGEPGQDYWMRFESCDEAAKVCAELNAKVLA